MKGLKEKLNSRGMKLRVDLVSNHTAKDNPYVTECPSCFINGTADDFKAHPDWFFELEKDGKITEDELTHAEKEIQKKTDEYIKEIDTLLGHKEKEIMVV